MYLTQPISMCIENNIKKLELIIQNKQNTNYTQERLRAFEEESQNCNSSRLKNCSSSSTIHHEMAPLLKCLVCSSAEIATSQSRSRAKHRTYSKMDYNLIKKCQHLDCRFGGDDVSNRQVFTNLNTFFGTLMATENSASSSFGTFQINQSLTWLMCPSSMICLIYAQTNIFAFDLCPNRLLCHV